MPFSKGDPNINRNGRPRKEHTLTIAIEEALATRDQLQGNTKITRNKAIAQILTDEALKGNLTAINMILDRMEGKPLQRTDMDITKKGFEITIVEPPETEPSDDKV